MDSLIAASARALSGGDALTALKHVALREDPPALALRGIAMAQLGEHVRARALLRRAGRGFGANEALAQARCVVAEAEVALAMRDFGGSPRRLLAAASILDARGDRANALQAHLIAVRRQLLLGRLDAARSGLAALEPHRGSPALVAVAALIAAELSLRDLDIDAARTALTQARDAAMRSGVPALQAEVAEAASALERPAARRLDAIREQALRLDEVAALLASAALVIDGCRRGVRCGARWHSLARRPVLFGLAQVLAQHWPGDIDRATLIAQVFRTRRPDESHRARLRVQLGRLRAVMRGLARIESTARGYRLAPLEAREVVLLAPPIDGEQASLLALLADGAAWSTSALALATGASQRTVQRALAGLEAQGRARSVGRARAQRWLAPPLTPHLSGITTILLLPVALPSG